MIEKYTLHAFFNPCGLKATIPSIEPRRGWTMNAERMRCIISGIKRFELTEDEAEFICCAEERLKRTKLLSETAELILEEIYSQKTEFIRDSIMSMLKQDGPATPMGRVAIRRLSA